MDKEIGDSTRWQGRVLLFVTVALASACGSSHSASSPPCDGAECELSVGNADVRACDVMLAPIEAVSIGREPTLRPEFADSARGSFKQRASELALAFVARDDRPLGQRPASITMVGSETAKRLRLVSATCYDRLGHAVDAPGVVLQGVLK